MPHLLFGPCDDPGFIDQFLREPTGRWTVFGARTSSWEAAEAQCNDRRPDALLIWPSYASVPAWVWSAPVPVVVLAADANLLWHNYKHFLPLADLVLTDAPSAERLRRAGINHVRAANLYGIDRHLVAALDRPEGERDIDVLFAGNFNPAIQGERLPWLGRVCALADRYKVVVTTGVFGADYRAFLRRAKLVFNRSIRGECNLRALEAAASGAVLLQEGENQEVKDYLQPGTEYMPYTAEDLESVIERLLVNDEERRAIVIAAKERARQWTFEALIRVALDMGGEGWGKVEERVRARTARAVSVPLAGRVWQRSSAVGADADPTLFADLRTANDRHALGVLASSAAEAESHLVAAAENGNRVSMVSRAVVLADLGRKADALAACRQTLEALNATELTPGEADSVPYPLHDYWLQAAWERAGYDHPDDLGAERQEKTRLLRGRALALVAEPTGEVREWEAALECCPEWTPLRIGLGMAFLRAGQPSEVAEHFRFAVEKNPFDNAAAQTLVETLTALGRTEEAERIRLQRRLLATAAPKLIAEIRPVLTPAVPPLPRLETAKIDGTKGIVDTTQRGEEPVGSRPAPSSQPVRPQTRFVDLSRDSFYKRFGNPDTSAALCDFILAVNVHTVLSLITHVRPRRVLAIGAATGQMTANLTAFTASDAVVYSVSSNTDDEFAQFVNHFGTAHKAMRIVADPRRYDFTRLAPLDFAVVDGGHDLATARTDSLAAYQSLRPGGLLAWQITSRMEEAITALAFPERVYCVGGTQVAFLVKGEGLGAAANADSGRIAVTWDGEFDSVLSFAHVNRSICAELAARGHDVALIRSVTRTAGATPLTIPAELAALVGRELRGAVHVRHRWPPDFTPPAGGGAFVLMQPWEHGRLPRAWIDPILTAVDEVWCYSRSVLRAYVASGVPESRLALVPPGVDPDRFRPGLPPLPLATDKRVKILFVGGTIPRKGFDVLLQAYRQTFTRNDDVSLIVKELGAGSFYQPESLGEQIRALQDDPNTPEIVHLTDDLSEEELPRLYTACDALVLPYRGEGFGLSALEAMACGLPVVVTAGGPTDEFVPQSAGWRVPARLRYFDDESFQGQPTAGRPWWLEPDADALISILKEVATNADERKRRGEAGRRAALGWTWARTASAVEDRVRVLRTRAPIRFQRRQEVTPQPVARVVPAQAESLSPAAAFAPAVTLRADEPFIVTAGPAPEATGPRPTGSELASLIVLCCNELDVTKLCIESILAHTRAPYELILIDNGSTDGTPAYLDALATRSGPVRMEVIHNLENRGYPAGVNQGLAAARGDYIVLLNNDVVVTPHWLDRLVRCVLHDWPQVGLAGAVTNYAPPPQLVEPGYADLSDLDAFAERRAVDCAGKALSVPRLTGFCLLVRRDVFTHVGRLDEGFGLGFFDDDDLCLRARRAGFRLAVTLDCYVHHFGSRTFRSLGVDTTKQLEDNLALYRAKWGAAEAAKYGKPVALPSGETRRESALAIARPVSPVVISAVAGKPRISLTMIVKNEEKNLPDCLASVRDLVDEAVVIDTGSTDRTREIAHSFGCVVGEFPWIDHFAAARNAALEKATGDYAFWMDADDRLDDDNRHKLKALFDSLPSGNAAYVMKCLCVGDAAAAGDTGTAVDHVRLFRLHPAHRWSYRVHEQILPSLRATDADVQWSEVVVRHVGYIDPAVRRRKLDRDLRLLKLDEAEKPNDPFTQFNLGSVYQEMGQHAEAANALERSLAGSHPKDSIVRKTYALLARCHHQGGDRRKAEATCRKGRQHYPDDAELLFLSAGLAREAGDFGAAEGLYRKLIDGSEGPHFASVDTSLRAVKGRHNLAVLLLEQGRLSEAEGVWRAALTHDPHFFPAQVGLGEVCIKANNTAGIERQIAALESLGEAGVAEAAVLLARWKAALGDHPGAIAVLEEAVMRQPRALGVRIALSHIHIAADSPPDQLEAVFRGVLELDPHNEQAKRNLEVLYRKTGRWVEGVVDSNLPPG